MCVKEFCLSQYFCLEDLQQRMKSPPHLTLRPFPPVPNTDALLAGALSSRPFHLTPFDPLCFIWRSYCRGAPPHRKARQPHALRRRALLASSVSQVSSPVPLLGDYTLNFIQRVFWKADHPHLWKRALCIKDSPALRSYFGSVETGNAERQQSGTSGNGIACVCFSFASYSLWICCMPLCVCVCVWQLEHVWPLVVCVCVRAQVDLAVLCSRQNWHTQSHGICLFLWHSFEVSLILPSAR